MTHRWMLLLAAVLACLLLPGCAGVMKTPCAEPRISNRVAPVVYVVKLPFALDEELTANPQAARLDTLLNLQSIAMAHNVGETHLTLLDAPAGGDCNIAEVYDTITTNRSGFLGRRLFHSAIFLWGDVFERRGSLYTQTYMRVFWNGREGTATVTYPLSAGEPPLEFIGRFPSSTIAFPPRRLPSAALAQLAAGLDGLQPRTAPEADAPVVDMPDHFVVAGSRDGWILLTANDGRHSWLSREEIAKRTTGLAPELEFVHAVTAYLHYRVTHSARSARISTEALQRFERQYPDVWQPAILLPLAIGDVIAGTLGQARTEERQTLSRRSGVGALFSSVFGARTLASEMRAATPDENDPPESSYTRALIRTPADGDVLTLSALGQIPACCTGAQAYRHIAEITRALASAHQIDAANPAAASNLLNWYRLLGRLDAELLPFSAEKLAERVMALERSIGTP